MDDNSVRFKETVLNGNYSGEMSLINMMNYNEVLEKIAYEYQGILRDNLVGIYVHGSIAFGCFNPFKSDIDFIAVVDKSPTIEEKEALIKSLLDLSTDAPSKGFEMSIVLSGVCKNFIYPTPFELHYSIAHLQRCEDDLREYCTSMNGIDKDLAAHFTVIKHVGYTLIGKQVSEVFGEVPKEDYLDSIKADIVDSKEDVIENPVYIILNLCRVLAYKNNSLVLSKEQGALWGIDNLPKQYIALVSRALNNYKSEEIEESFDREESLIFCNYMIENIFTI